jgi:uncharacterized SAM-binding protein YcdF (DUF218 family)
MTAPAGSSLATSSRPRRGRELLERLRKSATRLILPAGLFWLALLGWSGWFAATGNRGAALTALGFALAYAVIGNTWLANRLLQSLECDYIEIDPMDLGPFDAVFVLGGTTSSAPNGQPQLTKSGDRVMLAARMFHRGRTDHLVCSGQRMAGRSEVDRAPADEVAAIWAELGIPQDRIFRLTGYHTSDEMRHIRQFVEARGWRRLGLLTSAWHMRRAMSHAEHAGLNLVPIPANFEGVPRGWATWSIVPDADAFGRLHFAIREVAALRIERTTRRTLPIKSVTAGEAS